MEFTEFSDIAELGMIIIFLIRKRNFWNSFIQSSKRNFPTIFKQNWEIVEFIPSQEILVSLPKKLGTVWSFGITLTANLMIPWYLTTIF